MKTSNKLVHGWGINDVPKSSKTRYYKKWKGILKRVFAGGHSDVSYADVTVCEDWKYLSNFIKWVDSQPNRDWMDCEPDKDLIFRGNKKYSPEYCVFITKKLNMFLTENTKSRGQYLIGVTLCPYTGKFIAKCCNPFGVDKEDGRYLGQYTTEIEAHLVWKAKKT